MTEEALEHAIEIFARNFRSLLMTPPLRNRRVLAIDPGTRSGSKAVALDEKGQPVDHLVAHPLPPKNEVAQAKTEFANLIRKHNLSIIAIGNGAMCREMEQIVIRFDRRIGEPDRRATSIQDLAYVIANEAGTADYSESAIAREEFPLSIA